MNKEADSEVELKFLDAELLVNRVRPTPLIYWHTMRLYGQVGSRDIT
jgi:hypothetical protein